MVIKLLFIIYPHNLIYKEDTFLIFSFVEIFEILNCSESNLSNQLISILKIKLIKSSKWQVKLFLKCSFKLLFNSQITNDFMFIIDLFICINCVIKGSIEETVLPNSLVGLVK